MSSARKVAANRRNSLRSTGPKTDRGKQIAKMNAVTHGVFSRDAVVINNEGREEFDKLLKEIIEDLHPIGRLEGILVEKLVLDLLRLKRLMGYEAAEIERQKEEFLREAMERYQPVPLVDSDVPPNRKTRLPRRGRMEFYHHGDVVTEDEIAEQDRLIENLSIRNLIDSETALDIVCKTKLGDDDDRPDDWPDKAREHIVNMSPQLRGRLLKEVLDREGRVLAEMIEVYEWRRKFDVVNRILSLPSGDQLEKVARYETTLQRGIYRALSELRLLQERRQGT